MPFLPDVNKKILQDRLKALNLTTYKLAKRYGKIRTGEPEENIDPRRFDRTVKQALNNPDASSLKTLEALIKAMGGKLMISWDIHEEVVTGQKIVDFDEAEEK